MLLILIVLLMKPTVGRAESSEVQDAIEEPKIVRVYKGSPAPFDGALVPFNTLKRYEEFRLNYEIYKKDYENYGPIHNDTATQSSDKWAYTIMGILSGAVLGVAVFTDASRETKNMALVTGSLGVMTSFVLLVW